MIKKTLLTLSGLAALSLSAQATTITLGASVITGPFLTDSGGVRTSGVLILGTISPGDRAGLSAASTSAEIASVFSEFGTRNFTNGLFNGSVTNVDADAPGDPGADSFNGDQVYIWAFNDTDRNVATDFALMTLGDPTASPAGDDWNFPTNLNGVGDGANLSISDLRAGLDNGLPASVVAGNLQLVPNEPIPEPSGTLLVGLAGATLLLRRRR